MKVFLSYPMHGYSEEEQQKFKNELMEMLKAIPDITFVDNSDCEAPEGAGRLYYLGEAIKKMDGCDAIAMHWLYSNTKECWIELDAAYKYGLRVFYELSPHYVMRLMFEEALGYNTMTYSKKMTVNSWLDRLYSCGIDSVERLICMTKEDIMKIDGFGRVSSERVCDVIKFINEKYPDIVGKILYEEK